MVFRQLFVDETSSQRIFLEYLSKEIRITQDVKELTNCILLKLYT